MWFTEKGTERSRIGQGKAPSRDVVSSRVPFSLVPRELWSMSCTAELALLWGKGADPSLVVNPYPFFH